MSNEFSEAESLEQARAFHQSIEEHFSEVEDYRRDGSICGLNKLPIIGPLFNSKNFINQKTKILIVLTPYLIYTDQNEINWGLEQCRDACTCEEF